MPTDTARYRFTVKEGQPSRSGANDAPLSLMLEPMDKQLAVLKGGHLSLFLAPGTTMAQAQALARSLDQLVGTVAFTS